MRKFRFKYSITLIAAMPSVIIGAIAMGLNNVPTITSLQNIVCLLVGWLISCYVISKNFKSSKSRTLGIIILIFVLYILTFIDFGMDEVHRWLSLGPIRFYISSIFAPVLLIELWNLMQKNNELLVGVITAVISILLLLQPDASQITAFAIPMMIISIRKVNNKFLCYTLVTILTFLVITSWIFLDSLPAVLYVEEIVAMVMGMGLVWSILGFFSLMLLPLPFVLLPKANFKLLSRCLGLYYVIVIITTFFGNFPVPLMGYGISPIIGYLIAITWLIKPNKKS